MEIVHKQDDCLGKITVYRYEMYCTHASMYCPCNDFPLYTIRHYKCDKCDFEHKRLYNNHKNTFVTPPPAELINKFGESIF